MESHGCPPLGVQKLNFFLFRIFSQIFAIAEEQFFSLSFFFFVPLSFCCRTSNRLSVQFFVNAYILCRFENRFVVSTSETDRTTGRNGTSGCVDDSWTFRPDVYGKQITVSYMERLYLKRMRRTHGKIECLFKNRKFQCKKNDRCEFQ